MRFLRSFVPLGIGVFLGLAGGWLAFAPSVAAPGPERAGAGSTATATATASATGASPQPSASTSTAARSPIAELLSAAPPPEPVRGTGKIAGRVRTANGKPLAGVKVEALPHGDPTPAAAADETKDPDAALEASIRKLVAEHQRAKALKREAVTNEAGEYAFSDLARRPHTVTAKLDGYDIAAVGNAWQVAPDATIDFLARPVTEVEALVLLPDGTKAERATILIRQPGQQKRKMSSMPWSPSAPRLKLSAGTHELAATAGNDGELRSDPERVTVRAGEPAPAVALRLKKRPGIAGTVVFPEDETLESSHAQVRALRFAGAVPAVEQLEQEGKRAWAPPGGRYAFPDLAPGTYLVGAGREDAKLTVTQVVEVADALVNVDLTLPPIDPSEALHVIVLRPTGEPLEDVSFEATFTSSQGSASSARMASAASAVRRADGGFWVFADESMAKKRLGGGKDIKLTLDVISDEFGRKAVPVPAGESGPLVVRFSGAATLEVTIAGYAGSGLEDVISLSLVPVDGESDALGERSRRASVSFGSDPPTPDAEGRQTFGPVEEGPYEVVVEVKVGGDAWDRAVAERVPVNLRAGANAITVGVPAVYPLTVELGKQASLTVAPTKARDGHRPRPWWVHRTSDASGKVVFERLPAGSYTLTSFGEGGPLGPAIMTVSVPGATEVKFTPELVNAIRVSITDPNGYLAQAGFEDGDLIVGVDGAEFVSSEQMMLAFMASLARPEVKMAVQRGSQRFDIAVDGVKLMKGPHGMGGDFEPASRCHRKRRRNGSFHRRGVSSRPPPRMQCFVAPPWLTAERTRRPRARAGPAGR